MDDGSGGRLVEEGTDSSVDSGSVCGGSPGSLTIVAGSPPELPVDSPAEAARVADSTGNGARVTGAEPRAAGEEHAATVTANAERSPNASLRIGTSCRAQREKETPG